MIVTANAAACTDEQVAAASIKFNELVTKLTESGQLLATTCNKIDQTQHNCSTDCKAAITVQLNESKDLTAKLTAAKPAGCDLTKDQVTIFETSSITDVGAATKLMDLFCGDLKGSGAPIELTVASVAIVVIATALTIL